MAYGTLAQLKNYLGIGEEDDDFLLAECLDRASTAIDNYTGRRFSANTETRYYEYDAVDECYLYLDEDLLSITTLTNGDSGGTTIANTEYWLWPRNDGPPYYAIRLKTDSDYSWEIDTDYMISVAGTWGWSTTPPDDIIQACLRMAAYMYHQKDVPVYETTAFPDSGIISIPTGMPVDVKQLLGPYRKRGG